MAVFAKIFQAIRVQLCPLLCFPFSSKTGDVSQEPEGGDWDPLLELVGTSAEAGSWVAVVWGGQCQALSPTGKDEGRMQRNQPVSLGHT